MTDTNLEEERILNSARTLLHLQPDGKRSSNERAISLGERLRTNIQAAGTYMVLFSFFKSYGAGANVPYKLLIDNMSEISPSEEVRRRCLREMASHGVVLTNPVSGGTRGARAIRFMPHMLTLDFAKIANATLEKTKLQKLV